MTKAPCSRLVDVARVVLVIVILVMLAWHIATNGAIQWNFLSMSVLLVVVSATNLIACYVLKQKSWMRYTLFLFVAMVFGSLGDFLLAGIVYITPYTLVNGIVGFGIGHVFYLLALRNISPLLLRPHGAGQDVCNWRRLLLGNVAMWLATVLAGVMLFLVTVFNPADPVLSIGALAYGVLLLTVLAFALLKLFEGFPLGFRVSLSLGFLLFFLSDWVLAVRAFRTPLFLSDLFVGVTYIVGQLLIQLSPVLVGHGRS